MSVKHLRTAVAALALVTVAAVPAHADPWARDQAAASPAHTGAGLHARSVGLNERYGLGIGTTAPLVRQDSGDAGVDANTVAIGAAVALIAVGGAAVAMRRRPAPTI